MDYPLIWWFMPAWLIPDYIRRGYSTTPHAGLVGTATESSGLSMVQTHTENLCALQPRQIQTLEVVLMYDCA